MDLVWFAIEENKDKQHRIRLYYVISQNSTRRCFNDITCGACVGCGVVVTKPSWLNWCTWWCLWSRCALPALKATLYNCKMVISIWWPGATAPVIEGPPEYAIPFGLITWPTICIIRKLKSTLNNFFFFCTRFYFCVFQCVDVVVVVVVDTSKAARSNRDGKNQLIWPVLWFLSYAIYNDYNIISKHSQIAKSLGITIEIIPDIRVISIGCDDKKHRKYVRIIQKEFT